MNQSQYQKFQDDQNKTLKARVKASMLFEKKSEIVIFLENTLTKVLKKEILPSTGVDLIIQFLGQIVDEASDEVNSTDLLDLVAYSIRPESAEFLTLLLNIQYRFNNINKVINEIGINREPLHLVSDFIQLEIDLINQSFHSDTFE